MEKIVQRDACLPALSSPSWEHLPRVAGTFDTLSVHIEKLLTNDHIQSLCINFYFLTCLKYDLDS